MNPTQKSISWATTSPNPKKLKKKKIQSNGQDFLINPSCLLPSKAVDNSRTLRVSLPNPHSLLSSHTHKPSSLSLLSLPSTPNSFLSALKFLGLGFISFNFLPILQWRLQPLPKSMASESALVGILGSSIWRLPKRSSSDRSFTKRRRFTRS